MLRPLSLLNKATAVTSDGEAGTVADLFFDDRDWTVRYLVIDIGGWLFGRKILASPAAVRSVAWEKRRIGLDLTREQIERSPEIDTLKPITRQREQELYIFYGWPAAWPAGGFTSVPPMPPPEYPLEPIGSMDDDLAAPAEHFEDPHLRRLAEARRCRLMAADGDAGRVDDFLVEEAGWAIRSLVVAAGHAGRLVAVPAARLGHPRWRERELPVSLSLAEIDSLLEVGGKSE
ncbi:MAG: PRC-barrel domain-containing protein [Desulfobacteraceae bacterium]|nr:PRC-barrel domain-containing protein [Desulfobacteraceae bacterium]